MVALLITTALGIIFSILAYYRLFSTTIFFNPRVTDITCYNLTDNFLKMQAHDLNLTENTIYFLETSCKGYLNARQSCAVESASKANPHWKIFVMLPGPLNIDYVKSETFSALNNLKNVNFARVNVTEISKGTAVETLFSKNIITNSKNPVEHSSDLLRLLVLNKYGGLYLDVDVITTKNFDTLPRNFVQNTLDFRATREVVTNAVLRFEKEGIGKTFTDLALENFAATYDPASYDNNGPRLIHRVMSRICNNTSVWSAKTCQGVEVLSRDYFYPVKGDDWQQFYENWDVPENPAAYGYHVYRLYNRYIKVKPRSLFATLARKYCPRINKLHGSAVENAFFIPG